MKKSTAIILLLLSVVYQSIAQDLSGLSERGDSISVAEYVKENTKLSGNFNTSHTLYSTWGQSYRRDPYNYAVSANVNVQTMEVNLPFSFYFTNQNRDFRQPFNRFGVSPSYKWATAHMGYRSLSWSDFSLAGHTFLGGGIELEPSIFRFGFVYGRFRKAVDLEDEQGLIPSYKRMGYALKMGVGDDNGFVDFILFKGKDEVNSVSTPIDSSGVLPGENLVLAINGKRKISQKLSVEFEIAQSAFSEDIRSDAMDNPVGRAATYQSFGTLFTPRASTSYNNAYKAGLNFNPKKYKAALKYRRVEGNYRSMGSYFFNNDLEDVTLNFNSAFFKNKVTFNGSFGVQRNNLKEEQFSQTVRTIGSANVFWMINKKLNAGINYSNYTSNLQVVRDQVTDSINFYQVSHTTNFIGNYNFGTEEIAQSLSLNLGYQQANARSEYNIADQETSFRNANLNYRYKIKSRGLGLNAGLNYTQINSQQQELVNVGPTIGASKDLKKKKLRLSLDNTVLQQINSGVNQNIVNIIKLGANYRFMKKHSFGLISNYLIRIAQANNSSEFSEVRGTFRYQYSF